MNQAIEGLSRFEDLIKLVINKLTDHKGTPLPLHLYLLTYASEISLYFSHLNKAEVGVVFESSSHINEGAVMRVQVLAKSIEEVTMGV